MFKSKGKWLKVVPALMVLMVVMLLSVPSAFAEKRFGFRTSQSIETDKIAIDNAGNTMDYSVYVYGLTVYADAAASFMGVYDCDTIAELISTSTYPTVEIGEPTQYESTTTFYDPPFYFEDGVGVIISTGVGFVHYGAAPTG